VERNRFTETMRTPGRWITSAATAGDIAVGWGRRHLTPSSPRRRPHLLLELARTIGVWWGRPRVHL